jgi:IS30 family transposase
MVMISDRPAEAPDRAVPGRREGDLIIGKDQRSQIGALVQRASRHVLLVHLPAGRDAETVRDALADTMPPARPTTQNARLGNPGRASRQAPGTSQLTTGVATTP